MSFDFTSALTAMRKVVHATMRVPATYEDSVQTVPVDVGVRWHSRLVLQGDLVETGYADSIEGVDRVIFDRDELDEQSIVLHRGGIVRLTDPRWNGTSLILDSLEPADGPVELIWKIARGKKST